MQKTTDARAGDRQGQSSRRTMGEETRSQDVARHVQHDRRAALGDVGHLRPFDGWSSGRTSSSLDDARGGGSANAPFARFTVASTHDLEDTWAWWDKTGFGPDLVCGSLRGHLMLRSR